MGGRPVHRKMFSNISRLYPLNASGTPPPLSWDNQKCLQILPNDIGKLPWVERTTGLKHVYGNTPGIAQKISWDSLTLTGEGYVKQSHESLGSWAELRRRHVKWIPLATIAIKESRAGE